MSIAKEFREFAIKGNVIDMSVGIVIGAAFGKIVSSLVSDVLTPPLGYLIGGVDFTGLAVSLPPLMEGKEAVRRSCRRAGELACHCAVDPQTPRESRVARRLRASAANSMAPPWGSTRA